MATIVYDCNAVDLFMYICAKTARNSTFVTMGGLWALAKV